MFCWWSLDWSPCVSKIPMDSVQLVLKMICSCSSAGYRFQKRKILDIITSKWKVCPWMGLWTAHWRRNIVTWKSVALQHHVWPLHWRELRSLSNPTWGWYFSLPLQSLRKSHNSSQGNKETQKRNHEYQQLLEKLKSEYSTVWFQRIKVFRTSGSKNTTLETMDICRSCRFSSVYQFSLNC